MRRPYGLLIGGTLALLLLVPAGAQGQQRTFGSADDPAEVPQTAWWKRERFAEGAGGLSLIGAQWRSAVRAGLYAETGRAAVRVDASLRAGIYGPYDPETDQGYDALRTLRYARIQDDKAYLRIGPVTRMRLGNGHLVDFYNGAAAWDERRLGAEGYAVGRVFSVYGFTDDVRLTRLTAGRAELRPLGSVRGRLGSITLGGSLVTDRSPDPSGAPPPEAWQADVRMEAVRSGSFGLYPFVSFARYTDSGQGLLFGADLEADNLVDLARVSARLAVHYGTQRFIPGHFGAFYDVHGGGSRILSDEDGSLAGVPLAEAAGGNDILSEIRLHAFDRFELWYAFRRHYGFQALSTYHLRLFFRTDRLRFTLSQDRGGLKGFFSLFNELGSESLLGFHVEYRATGPVWLTIDARYTYVRDDVTSPSRFVVQRRFEPFVGLRTGF